MNAKKPRRPTGAFWLVIPRPLVASQSERKRRSQQEPIPRKR